MKNYSESDDNLLPEYDLSKLKGGVRGKYAERCKAGIKVVPPNASMTFEFRLILKPIEMTEELGDALYEAGCDDGTLGVSNGVPFVCFHRQAKDLESAIRSAVADVQKAGCVVDCAKIEGELLAPIA